jgi:CheY-like chemotaxis protein
VLIVDDDEGTRTIIGTQLELDGYNVTLASSGTQAMDELSRHSPDVILLDYRLGDIDGLQVLRMIRSNMMETPPAVAVFTADWNLVDNSSEIRALNAILVSKLCDLDRVRELVLFLSSDTPALPYIDVFV